MAAWADRALPADAAAEVELHLSNCDRCQEVLAAFVRSAPAAGAVVIPFWARRPVQWSAAGLAAAAALVAMIWIGRPPAVPTPESTIASAPSQPIPVPSVPTLQSVPSVSPSTPEELKKERQSSFRSAREEQRRDRPARALDDKAAANQATAKKETGRAAADMEVPRPAAAPAVAAPPPPPPPAAAQVAPPPPPITVSGAAAAVTPVGATRPAAVSESVAMDAVSVVSVVPLTIEIAAPDMSAFALAPMAGGAGRGGGGGARALSRAPGPTRWRIVAGTRVERTIDAGATWTALPITPELKTPLLAGSATSPLNCWLVGREGVVLVTHDGLTFRRVSVPEAVHLVGVLATDGKQATVTAIDGRRFSTVDGGLTWR